MDKFCFGMSSCGFQELNDSDFVNLSKAGAVAVEVSLKYTKYQDIDYKAIKQRADKYGINLWSFHLPFEPFDTNNIASVDSGVRKNTIVMQSEYIKKASDIGINMFVIHPSGEPNREEDRNIMLEYASENLAELAEIASKEGSVIAVENLPRTCLGRNSTEIKKLISKNDKLKVCFDTNHLLSQTIKEFIEDVGDKIITTHLSDYDFKNERHWLPGEGKIDWVELIQKLDNVGYTGPLIYEVNLMPPENGSIERRVLTFEDFRENYNCLYNKLPLKAIGRPALEECL